MSAEWIDACRHPVVPGTRIHAAAASPLLLVIVWLSWTTVAILFCVSITMAVMQMKGREPIWVLRRLQVWMRSGRVEARPLWYRRRRTRMVSYDLVDMDLSHQLAQPVVYRDLREYAVRSTGRVAEQKKKPAAAGGRASERANRSGAPAGDARAMPSDRSSSDAAEASEPPIPTGELRPKPFGPGRLTRPLSRTPAA